MPAQPELQRVCKSGGESGRTPEAYDKHAGNRKGTDAPPQGTSEQQILDPASDAAKIRAFFVHPEWVRRGIATQILKCCEEAARAAGFRRCEMGATLTGVPMYAACGYREVEEIEVPLANGTPLPVVKMAKTIA